MKLYNGSKNISDRKQQVEIEQQLVKRKSRSDWTVFHIYINSFSQNLPEGKTCIMFADVTIIITATDSNYFKQIVEEILQQAKKILRPHKPKSQCLKHSLH
jgi:hypothetical protein